MSILLVQLPLALSGAATSYGHALSTDGQGVGSAGRASAELLPAAPDAEVVAVVPAQALSWHQVELPRGTLQRSAFQGVQTAQRLQTVLEGLLEDRVLDETAELHFALAPDARAGAPVWVAVCDRAWLRAALQPLEDAKRVVARIVPELAPHLGPAHVHVLGTPEQPWLAASGEAGVTLLPLAPAAVALLLGAAAPGDDSVQVVTAEPALAGQAELLLQRSVSLQTEAERWAEAARSPWDLAQFGLLASPQARLRKRLARIGHEAWRGPRWRAARWGLGVLAAAHLAGLNAWAWKERSALDDKRAAERQTLVQTFPGVRTVVDAPVQMEREVALLRQGSGQASGRDLEALLGAAGATLPEAVVPTGIEFANGELRIRGVAPAPEALAPLAARLRSQGYGVRSDGDRLLLQPEGAP